MISQAQINTAINIMYQCDVTQFKYLVSKLETAIEHHYLVATGNIKATTNRLAMLKEREEDLLKLLHTIRPANKKHEESKFV